MFPLSELWPGKDGELRVSFLVRVALGAEEGAGCLPQFGAREEAVEIEEQMGVFCGS